MSKQTAVFGDLTALYATRSQRVKSINYSHLNQVIKNIAGVDAFDVNCWYTLFSPENDRQVSFVKGLKDLGWDVKTVAPRDVKRQAKFDPMHYRFDAQISYNLGLAVESYDQVIVISDSYELYHPIASLREDDPNIAITLAFYSDSMDPRWVREVRKEDSIVEFVDLEEEMYNFAMQEKLAKAE